MALDMKQRQSLKLTQQLVMTPQLQQAIKLLQLSRLEMLDTVQQEMLENPVIEEVQDGESPVETGGVDALYEATTTRGEDENGPVSDIDWASFLDNYYYTYDGEYNKPDNDDESDFEAFTSRGTTLGEHLQWQARMWNFSGEELEIVNHIIGNLDEDGYLRMSEEEIARETGRDPELVLEVLRTVQKFDPVGVAARNLQECLLIQTEHLGLEGTHVDTAIRDNFQLIEKKDPKLLAKALKCPEEEALDALKIILAMEPKPGRPFSEDRPQYIVPDIYIQKVGDEYIVVLNEDGMPKLRISNYYRTLLQAKGTDCDTTKDYIQDKLRGAVWLIKSIHQRQRTIYKVTKSIVKFQKDFLDRGVEHLKPLSLKDVARDIDMHESTVSRVTNNKYVHTPQGIYELKFFFNSSVSTTSGGEISAESVKCKILNIIESENPRKPLSDQEIVRRLREMGVDIARRTVTKYRESMNILSSTKRRKYI